MIKHIFLSITFLGSLDSTLEAASRLSNLQEIGLKVELAKEKNCECKTGSPNAVEACRIECKCDDQVVCKATYSLSCNTWWWRPDCHKGSDGWMRCYDTDGQPICDSNPGV